MNFVRDPRVLGIMVDTRCARAAGACVAVDLENAGKAVVMCEAWHDWRESGAPMRRRGREGLLFAPWRGGRLEELLGATTKLVEGPDAGVLKEGAARLFDGVKCSLSLGSGTVGSSSRRGV